MHQNKYPKMIISIGIYSINRLEAGYGGVAYTYIYMHIYAHRYKKRVHILVFVAAVFLQVSSSAATPSQIGRDSLGWP